MTPLERLLAEELPTGMFGGPRLEPEAAEPEPVRETGPDPDAAAHREALLAALTNLPLDARKSRHLRAVAPPSAA